jgi:hypothetical protein
MVQTWGFCEFRYAEKGSMPAVWPPAKLPMIVASMQQVTELSGIQYAHGMFRGA